MNTSAENPHAGQGSVLLDIGGDVGALIVTMPAEMEGVEVEIRPFGAPDLPAHEHGPGHGHGHGHAHGPGHYPHVEVVLRPTTEGPGAPYGAALSVPYDALVADVDLELRLSHTAPDDLDLLLVGPEVCRRW